MFEQIILIAGFSTVFVLWWLVKCWEDDDE